MRRWLALVGAATMMLALLPLGGGSAAAADPDVIPGSYIVVLNSGDPGAVAAEHRRNHNASVSHVYRHALRGYAAKMSDRAAARVARDPRVAYVDADRVVTTAHHQCGHNQPRPYQGDCDPEPPAPDPQPGTLSGTVTSGGSGLAGATVLVEGFGSDTTESDGSYAVANVPAGTYSVTASKTGYTSQTRSVTIDGNKQLDFSLNAVTTSNQTTPWGIDRVGAPLDNTGAGIAVYVIDTGIDPSHRDLNVKGGYAVERCRGGGCAAAWDDDHGHGTHVAGTIGALDNDVDVVGVAPGVDLYAVKVLAKNGSGTRSGVIAGVNWISGHNKGVPRVANMSLSGSGSKASTSSCAASVYTGSDSYHQAICNATNAGVVFAVAAGNDGVSASTRVPAAYDDAVVTVSATNAKNDWPWWSNWGTGSGTWIPTASAPVAIAAPGVGVLSTRGGGGTTTMSGTSMAAPHVAGALALYLAEHPTQAADYSAYASARKWLVDNAQSTTGWSNSSGRAHAEGFLQVTGL